MSQGFYGFPRILDVMRATSFKALGKIGATNGAALAGGTASGAPTAPAGPFDVGDVIVDASGKLWICTTAGTSQSSPGSFTQVGGTASPLTTKGDVWVYGSADARLAVGTNTYVLTADSTQTTGLAWAAPSGGTLDKTQLDFTLSSDISGTSLPTSWTDIIANQSFTVDVATSLIELSIGGFAFSNTGGGAMLRAVIDSAGTPVNKLLGGAYATFSNLFAGAAMTPLGSLTAGSHTVKLQGYGNGVTATFFCRPSSAPNNEFCFMRVVERKA